MIRSRVVVPVAVLVAAALGSGVLVGYLEQVAAGCALAVAALAAIACTRDLAARAELRARPGRKTVEMPPLEQLRQVGRALTVAQASEFGVDRELRPLLRPIAAVRLARRGVDLDRHPEEARAILGDALWEVVRADGVRGSNLVAGGIPVAGLEAIIERLERI